MRLGDYLGKYHTSLCQLKHLKFALKCQALT